MKIRWNMNFSVMWCHWYQHCCHVIVTASSKAQFCSLGEENWNEVCHDSFAHVMLLAPVWASHYTDGNVNSTVLFARLRWLKQGTHDFSVTWCKCWNHMTLMAALIQSLHLLVQDDQNEMQNEIFSYLTLLVLASASCDANGIVNNLTVLIRTRQLKQYAT